MEQNKQVRGFLDRHGICTVLSDPEAVLDRCLQEMEQGIRGADSSLAMIPTWLPEQAEDLGSPVAVMDVGGTNTRVALAQMNEKQEFSLLWVERHQTPGVDGPISADAFYGKLAEYVLPAVQQSRRLAVCFSFATEPCKNLDAVVTAVGKQLQVEGLLGSHVGAGIAGALQRLGLSEALRIAVINDTVAVYLSGLAADPARRFGGYLGLVLGTGLNVCHREPMDGSSPAPGTVVNQECGGYLHLPAGDLDRAYFAGTLDPQVDWCEKMVSGRYFGELTGHILWQAAAEKLLSETCRLPKRELNNMDITEIMNRPTEWFPAEQDRTAALSLIDAVMERAALYTAVCLTASLLRSGAGEDAPVRITADGSMYEKLPGFQEKLARCMEQLARARYGKHYEFYQTENAALLGTVYAGLLI